MSCAESLNDYLDGNKRNGITMFIKVFIYIYFFKNYIHRDHSLVFASVRGGEGKGIWCEDVARTVSYWCTSYRQCIFNALFTNKSAT